MSVVRLSEVLVTNRLILYSYLIAICMIVKAIGRTQWTDSVMTWLNWLCRISGLKIRFVWNVCQNSGEESYLTNSFVIEFSVFPWINDLKKLVQSIGTSEKIFKRQSLESLLNKCSNITKVIIHYDHIKSNELLLFGQYCPRLKSLYLEIKSEEDLQFIRQYGHKLEELYLFGINEKRQVLELCPNVKNVWFNQCSLLFTSDKEFLPKLEYFGRNSQIDFTYTNEMKIFSEKYSQAMKKLNIYIFSCTFEELKIFSESISRFENLRSLRLGLREDDTTNRWLSFTDWSEM